MLPKINKNNKGFTLIELLVVIAIIAILATVVFVALDPATRFADSRNSRRWNDVNSILTAVHQCIVDNEGILADCSLATTEGPVAISAELTTALVPYLKSIPLDPQGGGYTIEVDANNIVTIAAPAAENGMTVEVSR